MARDLTFAEFQKLMEGYMAIDWEHTRIRIFPKERCFHYYDENKQLLGGGDLHYLIETLIKLT